VESGQHAHGNVAQTDGTRARAMVYHALAEALAGPVPGITDLLLDAVTAGVQALDSGACRKAALALAESPMPDLEALYGSYTRLFGSGGQFLDDPPEGSEVQVTASAGRRPVALYESLHRRGCLGGQPTWDVERHYRALGLAPVGGELPDHASVELAYLGHLASAETEAGAVGDSWLVARLQEAQRGFLRSHAGAWLPEVGLGLATAGGPFYAAVGYVLSGFLSEELSGRKRRVQAQDRLPTLKDAATCTLCGLCVGSCPTNALRIIESATETTLRLYPTQCTGCKRCVRTCPEQVLSLSLGAENGADCRVMRQSPRVRCPNCSRPTVSQAELAAVWARLQPDSAMRQRLCLCVECKSLSP
jgi:NAD-dependent dihydropyrimidine dehydrogenase PreA subunit